MQQLLAEIRADNDEEFADVPADALRRADVQRHDDGTFVISLRVSIYPLDTTYHIELECEPRTQPALLRVWQHSARPAQARAIHGRACALIRASLGAPDETLYNSIALLPACHMWEDRAQPAGFVSPAEQLVHYALYNGYNVWRQHHPDTSRLHRNVAYDSALSLAIAPLNTRLLGAPLSDAARAVAACQRALAEYLALLAREDALERALRVRGIPAVDATHWIAPRDDDLDKTLATLLA